MKKRLLTAWIIACMFICLVGQTPIVALADGDDTRVISVPEGLQNVLINEAPETQTAETEIIKEESTDVQTQQNDENNDVQSEQGEATGETDAQNQTVGEDETSATQNEVIDETKKASTEQNETATEIPAQNQPAQGENVIAETVECVEQSVEALLPEGTHNHGDIVRVSGLLPKDAIVEAIPVDVEIEGQIVLLAYDITIYENEEKKNAGICWQPEEGGLNVEFISSALEESEEEVNIWHMEDSEQDPEYVTAAPSSDDSVEFTAESFSVYVVTETKLTATIIASDGNTYEINVTYDNKSGIPMDGTALKVDELKPGDDGYDEYIEESASKVGAKAEDLEFSKVFDIKIVDENDENTVYEPTGNVDVNIRVIGVSLSDYSQVNVLHFVEQRNAESRLVYDVDSTVNDETVEFSTDSFSVYVVIGHEGEEVVTPRVMFHFIADGATSQSSGSSAYYIGSPYSFINKSNENQTTQILKDGETLELIKDPDNKDIGGGTYNYFYGWYIVNPYVVNNTTDSYGIVKNDTSDIFDDQLYYEWPNLPSAISFEKPISISGSNVNIGDDVDWTMGDVSGTGTVDSEGNVHVLLAPVFDKYSFISFMLRARDDFSNENTVMTRKLIAMGSADSVDIKISDIRSTSMDSIHLIFAGWEYYNGTDWVPYKTIDPTGAEIKDPGKDGVYFTATSNDENIVLYPIFVEARWVDFVSGASGSGAKFVGSRFLKAWGVAMPEGQNSDVENENYFSTLEPSERTGYDFEGWYAFANTDEQGRITNLNNPEEVTINYISGSNGNYTKHTKTIETTAIKISDASGNIVYDDTYYLNTGNGSVKLFSGEDGKLKFYDNLDRLTLYANWTPDESKITVVYWTEDVRDEKTGGNPADENTYTASAIESITTAKWASVVSGATITRDNLATYLEGGVSVLSTDYLDDVGAVPAGEEMFYELNRSRSDNEVIVKGDGSTIFNVYYSRMTFKLVFHLGRDGYVKTNGQQKEEYMEDPTNEHYPKYTDWDGNWIQFMYGDNKITRSRENGGLGYIKGPTAASKAGVYSMTYKPNGTSDQTQWETYTTQYVTTTENVMGDYVPNSTYVEGNNTTNIYVIEAKYGAYIGDRWPTPTNDNFVFTNPSGSSVTMYTWSAYYGSRYCYIAHHRSVYGNPQGNNPDINGVYNTMSAELCMNRAGTGIINDNKVHHIVAYFGDAGKEGIIKNYHILYEAIDGTYDTTEYPSSSLKNGIDYSSYNQTTWSAVHGDVTKVNGHTFYEVAVSQAISNVEPQFQMGWEFDGFEYVYSCYNTPNTNDHHIYFFYTPKKYSLTFMYDTTMYDEPKTNPQPVPDEYYYGKSLSEAKKPEYIDPSMEGYNFIDWYANEAGVGNPFDFANEKMPSHSIVLYPVFKKKNYVIKIDPNGGVIDRWHQNSSSSGASTGFRADYKEIISAYNYLERDYIQTNAEEIARIKLLDPTFNEADDIYYYMNAQYLGESHDGNFIPSRLRNALYLTASEINEYWDYYDSFTTDQFIARGATKFDNKNDWMDAYFGSHNIDDLTKYRKVITEHYTFMGWYQVRADGTVDTVPFDFNTQVTSDIEIRAMWRLDGGYYVKYEPTYYAVDNLGTVTEVIGEIDQWTDPENLNDQLYADLSPTLVLRAPTHTTSGWIFRGWQVVRANGTSTYTDSNTNQTHTYTNWEPIQLDNNNQPIYYQPGDNFTIDSALVSETTNSHGAIVMQAYYEPDSNSYRRPDVTNLILDANKQYGGYINTPDSTSLPPLNGAGNQAINEDNMNHGNYVQIEIGDLQSNLALRLYRYATNKEYDGVQGHNFFSNNTGFLLIGFDKNSDPNNPTTGKAYIPAYAANSIVAVDRSGRDTLYAMWEPMVYATFVNNTASPLTINLSGSDDTINIVNEVTGEFDREERTNIITIQPGSQVKVVLPKAVPGTDTITAETTNQHQYYKLKASAVLGNDDNYGIITPSTARYEGTLSFTGTLETDPTGIVVTYTEEEERIIKYDVNGGVWTEPDTSSTGSFVPSTEDTDVYSLAKDVYEVIKSYEPTEPTPPTNKIFLGWTKNPDIAAHTDFSGTEDTTWGETTITPGVGENILDVVKRTYLWNFEEHPPYGDTLYAVYSDKVTVTFDIVYNGTKLHKWTGPTTTTTDKPYVYYRSSDTSQNITYTMAKGDKVQKPDDPTPHTEHANWNFVKWFVYNSSTNNFPKTSKTPTDLDTETLQSSIFDMTKPVTSDQHVITSWTAVKPQYFIFTVENRVPGGSDEEFEYTISVDEFVYGKHVQGGSNALGVSEERWGSVTTSLKNNEVYTVLVKVLKADKWGGVYSTEINVIDEDGNTIKTGQVVYCVGNTYKHFVSDYKFTLSIVQTEKNGYNTTVKAEIVTGNFDQDSYNTVDSTNTFSFLVKKNSTTSGTGASECIGAFSPTTNGFVENQTNTMTVVFTNERPPVAPTNFETNYRPFFTMFGFGAILIGLIVPTVVMVKRRKKEEE